MNESQRAMVAAKIANMRHGGDRRSNQAANLPLENVSQPEAAKRESAAGLRRETHNQYQLIQSKKIQEQSLTLSLILSLIIATKRLSAADASFK
jgi:hypothetical protein